MLKEVLSVGLKGALTGAKKAEAICEQVFQKHIAPFISRHAKNDEDVKRAAGLAYRFIPFFARFVVSKERFQNFVLNRVRFFVKRANETAAV